MFTVILRERNMGVDRGGKVSIVSAKNISYDVERGYFKISGSSGLCGVGFNPEEEIDRHYMVEVLNEKGVKVAEFIVPRP